MVTLAMAMILFPTATGMLLDFYNATSFIRQCLKVKEAHFRPETLPPPQIRSRTEPTELGKCLDYQCFVRNYQRDLRHLDQLPCRNNADCASDISKMICRRLPIAGGRGRTMGFCDCPRGRGYNPLSCQCEAAEQCGNDAEVRGIGKSVRNVFNFWTCFRFTATTA